MSTELEIESPHAEALPFPDDVHFRRRQRFLEAIGGGVAVIPAAPVLVKSRDTEVRYRQDSDFFFLTGFREPEAVAVLTPHDDGHRFTLFVRPRNPDREVWDGPRAGVEGAVERHGADAAYPASELEGRLKTLLEPADAVWYALGASDDLDRRIVGLLKEFRRTRPRSGKGPADVRDPAAVLDAMRRRKEPGELERLRASAAISAAGHRAAMRAARPGAGEWELEAAVEGAFRAAHPHAGLAFATIVGSGPNATVLHYVTNERRMEDGELVLVDAGAELGYYCTDITRTFPVSGRFTPAQRRIYEVVLAAEEAAIAAARPGARFDRIHEAARRVLVEGMVDLRLLEGDVDGLIEREAFKRFFMHQTSHWLGLDTHDAGAYRRADGEWEILEPGMVLTVEPGLYVAADAEGVPDELRGVGIRIEDDVIVGEDGPEVITRGVPVDPDEIEALMAGG